MTRRTTVTATLTVALAMTMLSIRTNAAQAPHTPLVSTTWVAERLTDPNLVLLHVGPPPGFAAAHLPGAQLVQPAVVTVDGTAADGSTLSMQLPDAETLRTNLEKLGISDTSRIVVYVATPPWTAMATRVMLTLQHAGMGDRASLMDGGQAVWVAEGRTVTGAVTAPKVTKLSPLRLSTVTIDGDVVEAHRTATGFRIVDARAPSLYDGVQTGGSRESPHKTGHIAGAVSVPFNSTYDAQGRFKPVPELRELFAAAGAKAGDTLFVYCHIGQQATATIFAAKLAGFDAKLYDGSFEDWSKRPNAAVTNPAAKIK